MASAHKDQRGFGLLEALVIIVLLGVAGLIGWSAYQKRTNSSTKQAVEDIRLSNKEVPSNWKEYRNQRYAFSFKYPPNYSIGETDFTNPPDPDPENSKIFSQLFNVGLLPTKEDKTLQIYVEIIRKPLDQAIKNWKNFYFDPQRVEHQRQSGNTEELEEASVYKNGTQAIALRWTSGEKISNQIDDRTIYAIYKNGVTYFFNAVVHELSWDGSTKLPGPGTSFDTKELTEFTPIIFDSLKID